MPKIRESIPESAIRALFTEDFLGFLESNGRAMLIFKSLRIANKGEIKNVVRFTVDLVKHII